MNITKQEQQIVFEPEDFLNFQHHMASSSPTQNCQVEAGSCAGELLSRGEPHTSSFPEAPLPLCTSADHNAKFPWQTTKLISQSHQVWLIDMSKVDFLDSSGLFSLVTNLSAARSDGCRIIISNLQPSVRIIFELTQLDSVFEIC